MTEQGSYMSKIQWKNAILGIYASIQLKSDVQVI